MLIARNDTILSAIRRCELQKDFRSVDILRRVLRTQKACAETIKRWAEK